MKDQGCPYRESCPIYGSLQTINLPSLTIYCVDNYLSCRYYRSQVRAAQSRPEEVCV